MLQSNDEDIIEYVPVKVKHIVIVIGDSSDESESVSPSDKNQNNISSINFRRSSRRTDREPNEPKVPSEQIDLIRKKRPKITYFKLISDAFHDSNNTWLNCQQIRKRITQKYAYYRELGEKKWTNQIYGQLSKRSLFDRKNVKNERLKLYSLKENPAFTELNIQHVKSES